MMPRDTTKLSLGNLISEPPRQPAKLGLSALNEKTEPFDRDIQKDISGHSTRKSNMITLRKQHLSFNCSEEEKTPGK
jgi:hypothetical protein